MTERPTLRWLGTVTAVQLEGLLDDAERALRGPSQDPLERALADADRLAGRGDSTAAAVAFRALLARASPDWPERTRVEESLVSALEDASAFQACAQAAHEALPGLPQGHSRSDLAGTGLFCAVLAPDPCPWRASALAALEPAAEAALGARDALADDRSGLYEALVLARKARGEEAGARRLAARWLAFLEAAAASAPCPEARAAFDAHRVEAALALGDPARALPPLRASERDLPGDFNGPARLALVLRELGRWEEALAASDRALALAEGPRRLRILFEKAEVYRRMGDRRDQRRTLGEALTFAKTLSPAQRPAAEVQKIQRALGQ